MHLYKKEDATLGVFLIFSAVIVFQRPLRLLLDAAHEVEVRYSLDLIPALTVLMAVLAFHEYQKRQRARIEKLQLEAEVGRQRARSDELERCIRFAQVLADTRDELSLEQSLWRHLPDFVRDDAWLLTCKRDTWRLIFQNARSGQQRPVEDLEEMSRKALAEARAGGFKPVSISEETCFPLVVGGRAVGVLGVRQVQRLTTSEQESLLMATALIALTIKNIQQLQEITEDGVRDSLTGCYNRRHGVERLAGELRRANRSGRSVSLLMVDLDQFKAVNDTHGHLSGDRVLARVGAQLLQSLRSTDIPCRYGGDEFLIVLPETPGQAAEHVAACLRRDLAAVRFAPDEKIATISVSIGAATSTPDDLHVEAVIGRADRALFAAKGDSRRQPSAHADGAVSAAAP